MPLYYFFSYIKLKLVLLNNRYGIQTLTQTNKTIQMSHSVQNKSRKGSEGEQTAIGTAANKGGSGRGRKTGRYAKGFSMFNFQIGLSRMTFS